MGSKDIVEFLKKRSARITPDRQRIIDVFCSANIPLSANDIIKKVRCNKTTVYREISFLLNIGVIKQIDLTDCVKRYELNDTNHHHHLVCIKCKRIISVDMDNDLVDEEKRISKLLNFNIQSHNLEFFGYCQKCHR